MERIYLLEDDDSIRKLVIYALGSQGYEAQGFDRPSDFWSAMEGPQPALILLDIMLPEEDGLSILQKLRASAATKRIPVIMLTAKNTEYDRVVGLDSGADDFISKPFGMMELVARVRAVLRRTEQKPETEDYQVGDLFVSPQRHVVRVAGEEVPLTNKEFELLCLLLEHQGMAMTRDAIMDGVRSSAGRTGPWMSMCGPCGPSWALPGTILRPSGGWAIRSEGPHDGQDFPQLLPGGAGGDDPVYRAFRGGDGLPV